MNILIYYKGVGAQIVIWTFYDQVVKVEKEWVEQEFVLLIIAPLPDETGLKIHVS
jgi:hypothetical protein